MVLARRVPLRKGGADSVKMSAFKKGDMVRCPRLGVEAYEVLAVYRGQEPEILLATPNVVWPSSGQKGGNTRVYAAHCTLDLRATAAKRKKEREQWEMNHAFERRKG